MTSAVDAGTAAAATRRDVPGPPPPPRVPALHRLGIKAPPPPRPPSLACCPQPGTTRQLRAEEGGTAGDNPFPPSLPPTPSSSKRRRGAGRMATVVVEAEPDPSCSIPNPASPSPSLSHRFLDSKFYLLVVIGELVTEEHLKRAIGNIEREGKLGKAKQKSLPAGEGASYFLPFSFTPLGPTAS
uniref:Uncharacterized protein n=1 Tax=Chrysemys picta bellii TaxID=8478 RepID=A0A8C3EZ83_CHRPI